MSTATAFKYYRVFPFCLTDEVPAGYDYVGGLTLTQIMKVWWSLETLSVSVTGNYTNPTFLDEANINMDLVFPNVDATVLEESSLGAIVVNQPNTRVCIGSPYAVSAKIDPSEIGFADQPFQFQVYLIVDPDDPDFYAIAYQLSVYSESQDVPSTAATAILNPTAMSAYTGTPEFSGDIDFDGIALPWVGGAIDPSAGAWVSGGTDFDIEMTPAFFTY